MIAPARTALPSVDPPRTSGIPLWFVVISGFTQRLEHPNGCQHLWNSLRRFRCDVAATILQPWNADWPGFAEFIWRFRPADRPPRVFCFPYSWGGGWGLPNLARELAKRDIEIEHAVTCDAVYRPRFRVLDWQALTRRPVIVMPSNVREVSWFYQRTGVPAGHQIVAEDPQRTKVNAGVKIDGVTHHYMDDQSAWWMKCLSVASSAEPAPPYGSLFEKLVAA